MPLGLAGEPEYGPPGLTLHWHPNTEEDLQWYAVYRGTTDDFLPGPGNLVGTTADTLLLYEDPAWNTCYYKVAAVDVHGNESPYALLRPEDVTGDDPAMTPRADFLLQNVPNPFNPVTEIRFGLQAAGHARLAIFDAAGRLVRVLLDGHRGAGPQSVTWDGRGTDGRAVASGVYFYRLEAGAFIETRKMVLLR